MHRTKLARCPIALATVLALIWPWPVVAGPLAPDTDQSMADTIFQAETTGDWAGRGAAGLGDVNGDGLPDFAVGAPGNGEGSLSDHSAGKVYHVMLRGSDAGARGP